MNSDSLMVNEGTLLILEDGRVLARNVTVPIAKLLFSLHPEDRELALRAGAMPIGNHSHQELES